MATELDGTEKSELLSLLNDAHAQAQRVHDRYISNNDPEIRRLSSVTLQSLAGWIDAVSQGKVRVSRRDAAGAAGMGLWRGVSEWCEDDALLNAVDAAEKYYRKIQS